MVKNAKEIDGWMHDRELQWLAEQAAKAKVIIEVGSWFGRSTRALADNVKNVLFAVDSWNGSPLEAPQFDAAKAQGGDHAFLTFCDNLWDQISAGRLIPLRMQSENAARFLSGKVLADLIFIDASHAYEFASADINNFLPLLAPNGIICGHDYGERWPGVVKAVNEMFTAPEKPVDTIWSVTLNCKT